MLNTSYNYEINIISLHFYNFFNLSAFASVMNLWQQ